MFLQVVRTIVTGVSIVLLAACGSNEAAERGISETCAEAFEMAASVSEFQDKHSDLFPAFRNCSTKKEWIAASALYPDAIDGVDPVKYAMTVCGSYQTQVGYTALCHEVNQPKPAAAAVSKASPAPVAKLARSQERGLLGVPLPEGSKLDGRTAADPAAMRDATERYTIDATAADIASYFDAQMPGEGWQKLGTSTATALMYQKTGHMVGVMTNRNGGTFTLIGS